LTKQTVLPTLAAMRNHRPPAPAIPLRCRFKLHRWSAWEKDALYHMGEDPWERWQHMCATRRRWCVDCDATMRRGNCVGGWVVSLPAQPYRPTRQEIQRSAEALLQRA